MDATSKDGLSIATNYLLNRNCIGEEIRYRKSTRYVLLNSQALFNALISLYEIYFRYHSSQFQNVDFHSPYKFAATVYVSYWFIDLYVSIRECANLLSCRFGEFSKYFSQYQVHHSYEYDKFLATLNAHIRPTQIHLALENTLYVPLISAEVDFKKESPFDIDGFILNPGLFDKIMGYSTVGLSESLYGKPTWLLDWHGSSAFAWFPQEGNYSMDDISIAYILGTACTPPLGPRDVDEWQCFPDNIFPERVGHSSEYDRVTPQTLHGNYEVHVVETENWEIPDSLKAAASDFSATDQTGLAESSVLNGNGTQPLKRTLEASSRAPEGAKSVQKIARYRLVDWLYQKKVILRVHDQLRHYAFRMI